MGLDVAACLLDVELRQRRVVGTGACHQHVIDLRGQVVEELPEPLEVGSIEGHDAGAKFEADAVQAIGVSRCENHLGSLAASKPGRFESDARTAADHDDGLSTELRLAAHAIASNRSTLLVRVKNVILCLHYRMALVSAVVGTRIGRERVGCGVIVEQGVSPSGAVRKSLAILFDEKSL